MPQDYPFLREDVFPSWIANRIQDFLSAAETNLRLTRKNSTDIEVIPDSALGIAAVALQGRWRFNEATVSRSHPGGAKGTYIVWAVGTDNDVDETPKPHSDHTDYAFDLRITSGANPSGAGVEVFEKIGEIDWSGTEIEAVRQTLNAVTGPMIADGALSGNGDVEWKREATGAWVPQIKADSVGASELADNSVDTNALIALAVTTAKVAADAITEPKIANLAVTAGKLGEEAVKTGKIANLAVTAGKIANLAIETAKLAAKAVTEEKLGDEAVNTGQIKALAVTSAKLAAEAVTGEKVGALAITAAKIAAEAIETGKIANLAVTEAKLANEGVATAKIKNLAVTASKIAEKAVGTAQLEDLGVTAAKIAAEAVNTGQIKNLAVTAAKLAEKAVETAKIADGAVTAPKLAIIPAAALSRGTEQEVEDSVTTTVAFTEKIYDTDGMWSEAEPTKLTIKTDGLYLISFTLTSFTETIEDGYAVIETGAFTAALNGFVRKKAGGSEWLCNASTIESLTAGTSLTLKVNLNTSSGKAKIFRFAGHTPVMRVARLGRIS